MPRVKVVGLIEANLAENPLGLASRAIEDLGGKPVLRRVVETVLKVPSIARTVVVTRPADGPAVREAVEGLPVDVRESELPDAPRRGILRRARKWARFGWRGGLHWTTAFDEHGWPKALLAAAEAAGADSAALFRAEAPLVDARLAESIVAHHLKFVGTYYFTFAQAPVGLVPEVCTIGFLKTMALTGQTPLEVLRYKKEDPKMDRVRAECHFDCGDTVRRAPFRLAADSGRGLAALRALWAACPDPETADAARWIGTASRHPEAWLGGIPPFASIEAVRSPGAAPVPAARNLPEWIDPALFERLCRALSAADDACLSIEGFGDPLAHPELPRLLEALSRNRIYGRHLVSPGTHLTERAQDLLFEADLDVLEVPIGAHSAETYRRLAGADGFDRVRGNLRRFLDRRKERGGETPFLLVSIAKRRETEPEVEAFYDDWLAAGAWPVIRPANRYAGQVPDASPFPTNLAARRPCVKIANELYIDTAGEPLVCREDLAARHPLAGDPAVAWAGERLSGLRAAHARGDWGAFPLCPDCTEWDRF